MPSYAPHRQRLPLIAVTISSALGCGVRSSSASADISCPGVQNWLSEASAMPMRSRHREMGGGKRRDAGARLRPGRCVARPGTVGLEFEEQVPLDTLLVAVGGGGLIGGIAAWYEDRIRIIGVEPVLAPTLPSLQAGKPVDAPAGGIAADSLAPGQVGKLMFPLARKYVKRPPRRGSRDRWRAEGAMGSTEGDGIPTVKCFQGTTAIVHSQALPDLYLTYT